MGVTVDYANNILSISKGIVINASFLEMHIGDIDLFVDQWKVDISCSDETISILVDVHTVVITNSQSTMVIISKLVRNIELLGSSDIEIVPHAPTHELIHNLSISNCYNISIYTLKRICILEVCSSHISTINSPYIYSLKVISTGNIENLNSFIDSTYLYPPDAQLIVSKSPQKKFNPMSDNFSNFEIGEHIIDYMLPLIL